MKTQRPGGPATRKGIGMVSVITACDTMQLASGGILIDHSPSRDMQPVLPLEARSDLDSARTLAVVALILEIAFLAIGVIILLVVLVGGVFTFTPGAGQVATPMVAFAPILFFFALAGILGVLWILLTYLLVYVPLREGQVERALTPTLVIAILTLIFGGLIPGILLIVAYVKAKDAHTKILLAQRAAG